MFRMKSLRLGNFRTILEMLGPDVQEDDETARSPTVGGRLRSRHARAFRDGLNRMPDDRLEGSYVPLERLARLYGETRSQEPPPPVAPADDDAVAAELRLSTARSGEDLRRIRRSFAMRNHPDRVPDWLRDEATRRMRIANALIDDAMHEKLERRKRG
jgi:hypothetical protein